MPLLPVFLLALWNCCRYFECCYCCVFALVGALVGVVFIIAGAVLAVFLSCSFVSVAKGTRICIRSRITRKSTADQTDAA